MYPNELPVNHRDFRHTALIFFFIKEANSRFFLKETNQRSEKMQRVKESRCCKTV